ncbi:hypothetical protein BT96DRAFT_992303 [Gymnopus androsaceus JB14]|uniref:Uncharacterized protein n=1 Tax=Gymnopus androsaceus JB14 TaxID=1447944 RepID=A0A6A4HVG0_9AGAR|nr:hypothetical protein BT96DRAFT_992303 [Gymnopus androsaceus JB14]
MAALAQYLSQCRIEGPIWLEPTDISFLRARISDVEGQVENLKSQVSESTLPLEIVFEIFELACLPEEGKSMYEHSIVQYTSILCTVCVAWRRAAHLTPRLWSKFCLSLKDRKPVIPESGWSLHFSGQTIHGDYFGFRSQTPIAQLTGHISFLVPLFGLPCSSLPQLEEVHLEIFCFNNDFNALDEKSAYLQVPQQIETFLGVPKLHCVELIEGDTNPILKKFAVPAEQLTSLKITSIIIRPSYFDPDAYVDILRRCNDLVHLRVDLGLDFKPDLVLFNKHLSISLPLLRSLNISAHRISRNDVNLLHCLTTPHLEELTLRHNLQDLEAFSADVTSF